MERDTVVALSTPPGESGIAVVRLSGSEAIAIVDAVAGGMRDVPPHTIHKRILRDGSGEPIDEALVCVSRAPASYTGEDMAEIFCHGGMQVVADLLEETARRGARLAGPGEFTKRAYLNGRLDLSQAEAVVDLISAETRLQRTVALEQLGGRLSRLVRGLEEALLEQLAAVEVSIDFSEEDIPVFSYEEMRRAVRELAGRVRGLLEFESAGGKLRHGLHVTILGPRNVGKSSLYNALIGEERAIVSPVPGTTRDLLRERIHINGFTYFLEDTAGIAETGCEIEARGIFLGRRAAERADLVLFVVDGSAEPRSEAAAELARMDPAKVLCVLNKTDRGLAVPVDAARERLGAAHAVAVSALRGDGLAELRGLIFEMTAKRDAGAVARERVAVNARQAEALREALAALERLDPLLEEEASPELLSLELREAADALGAITGRSVAGDVLEAIFSRFCVGK